jgi:Icc protein
VTVAPSTYRQSELRLRDDPGMRSLDEPSGFLLHWIDGADCATHLVSLNSAGGPLGKF